MKKKTDRPYCEQLNDCKMKDGLGRCICLNDTHFERSCPFYKEKKNEE